MSDAFAIEACFAFVWKMIWSSTMTTGLTVAIGAVTLRVLKIIVSTTIGWLVSRIRVRRALSLIIRYLISGSITWVIVSSAAFTSAIKLETNRSRIPVMRIVSLFAWILGVLLIAVCWVETVWLMVPWITTISVFIQWICSVSVFVTGIVSVVCGTPYVIHLVS